MIDVVEAAAQPSESEAPQPELAPVAPAVTRARLKARRDRGRGRARRVGQYLSREAASYRRRLRETEAERDQLREQLDRCRRAEVERLASADGLAVAGDVWLHGATLDTLRGEDGAIDAETVDGPGRRSVGPSGSAGAEDGTRHRPAASAAGRTPPKVGLSQLLKPGRAA